MKAKTPLIEETTNNNPSPIRNTPKDSETISKIIIEKIISYVMTQARRNIHSNRITLYCSSFTEETLKTFINSSIIIQDEETETDLNGYTFNQPPLSLIERDSSSQIHFDKQDEYNQYNMNEQNSIDTASPFTSRRLIFNSQSLNKLSSQESSNNLLTNLRLSPPANVPKSKKTVAIDIEPSFDLIIPPIGKQYEIGNIHTLRQEIAIEMDQKAKEYQMMNRRRIQISKSEVDINKDSSSSSAKKAPLFEMKTTTFDSNGKLIPLRYLPLESLKREFGIPRTEIKEETMLLPPKASSLPKILIPDDTVMYTNMSTTNKKHYKKDDPIKRIGVRYDYSGDNYEKIIPSPGVTVISQDELKSKKGDVNYRRDFKKLSMSDYRYISEEILPNISSPLPVNRGEPSNSIDLSTNCNNDSKSNNSFKLNPFYKKPMGKTKYDKDQLKNSTMNKITFKAKGEMSLSNVFIDNSEQTTSNEDYSLKNKLRHQINFIPKKKERLIPLLNYEQIDLFNKIILQDNNWGKHKDDHNHMNKKIVIIERNKPIKRDHVMNDIPDYRTRKLFFRK